MKGFTLLELMAVVAIIAILSATAIPTYQNYLIRGKVANARAYLDSFNSTITKYYSDHGTFPNNNNLNISSAIPTSVANYLHPPYLAYVTMVPQSTSSSQCPYTINTAHISNYLGDYYANSTSKYVVFNNYAIDYNGTMITKCSYYEYDPSNSSVTTSQYFPDCELSNNPTDIITFINSACN